MGLSMGGCLALRLAELRGDAIRGLVLVNPSITADTKAFLLAPVLKLVVPSLKGIASDVKKPGAAELGYDRVPVKAAATLPGLWQITQQHLTELTQPVLAYRSVTDHVVGPRQHEVCCTGALPPGQLEVRELADSYHVATLDNDAEVIFSGSLEFVRLTAMRERNRQDQAAENAAGMSGPGDVGGHRGARVVESGDEAAWRDLVARLGSPR